MTKINQKLVSSWKIMGWIWTCERIWEVDGVIDGQQKSGKGSGARQHVLYHMISICQNDMIRDWVTISDCGMSKKERICLITQGAHAEVTTIASAGQILRVWGYFEHNDACQKAAIARMPELPIHPSVYVIALAQLREGSSAEVQTEIRRLFQTCAYKGQPLPRDLANSNYRWLLQQTDFCTLYQKFNRLLGVDVKEAPHVPLPNCISFVFMLDPMALLVSTKLIGVWNSIMYFGYYCL